MIFYELFKSSDQVLKSYKGTKLLNDAGKIFLSKFYFVSAQHLVQLIT